MERRDQEITDGVIRVFRELSAVPHGSGREQAAGGLVMDRLRALGGAPERDGAGNVRCDLPASPGLEELPLTVVQGHLDMVCAVLPGGGYVPERDPVTVVTEGGFLRSDGRSSLGADNNLGNAAVLWLLEQGTPHGPLRLLFTTGEELGLLGAKQMAAEWLDGVEYLINTDGFQGDAVVVSSASGLREDWSRPLERAEARERAGLRLTLSGFRGGHSGFDIGRGRANPIALLASFLDGRGEELADFSGGHGFNAIPMSAQALLCCRDPEETARAALAWWEAERGRWREGDPEGTLTVRPEPAPEQVWTPDCRMAVLRFLGGAFIGVRAMHPQLPDRVYASANLGRAWAEGDRFHAALFLRSGDPALEREMEERHLALGQGLGFARRVSGYPGWPGGPDNPLARLMDGLYRERNGKALRIEALHVGLEPSIFLSKRPGLVMVSVGASVLDAHSVSERVPLDSVPPFVRLLADTLRRIREA